MPDTITTQPFRAPTDLRAEDAWVSQVLERRDRLRQRLEAAFASFAGSGEEEALRVRVTGLLAFVFENLHLYRSRVRLEAPGPDGATDAEWIVLCGAALRDLEAPPRVRRLLVELIAGLLPADDDEHRQRLAESAGVPLAARASAEDLKELRRKGLVASFAAQLLVEGKRLVREAGAEETARYFDGAVDLAGRLQSSPYLTGRDRAFLRVCEAQVQGDLVALVARQRESALREIARRDETAPGLERALRSLAEEQRPRSRSIEDWYIEARIAFQNEQYAYARLDELRTALQARIAELEAEPCLNPRLAAATAGARVRGLFERLIAAASAAGASLVTFPSGRLDPFQLVRDHASVLTRREAVAALNAFLGDPELVEQVARLQVATFKESVPDLRDKLRSDVVIWDEILRSAPVAPPQQERLAELRATLLEALGDRRSALPEGIAGQWMVAPFGLAVVAVLRSEADFAVFQAWLDGVRKIYAERASTLVTIPVTEFAGEASGPVPEPPRFDVSELRER